jgi:hypothetical protein
LRRYHGQFDHLIDAARLHKPAALILLRDTSATAPLHEIFAPVMEHTEIWFIHGATTIPTALRNTIVLYNSTLAANNLHGRVCEVAGYRIAGLNGIFRGQIWMRVRRRISLILLHLWLPGDVAISGVPVFPANTAAVFSVR